ncbi:MAG: hypothetical protein ABSB01_19730 [Streptosporangiaceae bacterium]|jgi:tetratricopeptide (TPR) repeat protein
MELAIGDPAAAERYLREGYEAFRAMGERGYFTSVATLLAKALYEQSRLDEAQQMIEEAKAAAGPDDLDTDVYWQTTRAKLLAWRGDFPAARRVMGEAQALISSASSALEQADVLMAEAEVNRFAGATGRAATSLRAALQIYEDRRATFLAEKTRAALASLLPQPGREPA